MSLPLTANGKLDRDALPDPGEARAGPGGDYAAPGSELERQLAEIWAEILKLDRVGVHDNFFDLGATSLLCLRFVARLRKEHGIDVPILNLFEYPTIRRLLDSIDDRAPPLPGSSWPEVASMLSRTSSAESRRRSKRQR